VTGRSLRHPIRGDHRYPKPSRVRRPSGRPPARQPRIRPRKGVSVAALVASPEDQPSRPFLRLNVVGLIVVALFGVMVLRLWTLQVIDAKNFAAAVTANQVRVVPLPAPRGLITDRNGTAIVDNSVQQEIVLSRAEAAQHPSVIGQVAALVGETPAQVSAALGNVRYSPYQPAPVLFNAPMATVQYLQEHAAQYPGVSVQPVTQRTYPQGGSTATHLLGYVGDINGKELAQVPNQGYTQSSLYGKTGLELEYEQFLRGKAGEQALSVNRLGTVVGVLRNTLPVQGDTVVTNVDLGLQQAVQNALQNVILTDRRTPDITNGVLPAAISGAAIVLNPQNGQVLAMASYPTYDLSQLVGTVSANAFGSAGAQNNFAMQGRYTPGSTFKLITATAALSDGVITPGTYVNDTGVFTVPNCTEGCSFHDDQNVSNGNVNMPLALTESDDYYFYKLGYEFWIQRSNPALGTEAIQGVAQNYGLDSYTGIDLPNEGVGYVDSPSIEVKLHQKYPKAYPNGNLWTTGNNIEMAFGQGGTVLTPLQLANAYATFANGGTRYQPQVAAAVVDPSGKVVRQFTPKVVGHVNLPPAVYQPILQGLLGVVANQAGTAWGTFEGTQPVFDLNALRIAGKTGTATNPNPHKEPTAWFVGFGPVPGPQYLVLCVVDQGGYGAAAAAPAVKQIFQYLETNPVHPQVSLPTSSVQPTVTPPPTVPPAGTPTTTTSTTQPSTTTSTGH
jgi:penicillin-binding protein 2